ncbi:c2H2-type zinc-finger domain-containing protein [Ditylenchus destructor]|uniref:C2H2-type zinc-finger domain-containing protein n=1 Tax=Ditylenchus destructor TaxID=166010 RepID=A0AAD4QX81_9BILA|nr:c2H2-type zinc-finger domain-containing protein [Ditylenchus destructor]
MNESSNSVMFRCDKCSAVIEGELAFLNHLSTQHFEYYPYRCGYCAENGEVHSTTTENKMKHHMETIHCVKDLKILVHKKHDIETKLQAIVEKCRLMTENAPVGLKSASHQAYNAQNEGVESSIRSRYHREATSSLPKIRESSVEASETTVDNTPDMIRVEESLTKHQDHNNRTSLANESNLLSDDAHEEFPVTQTTSKTRSKLISITAVDADINENQEYFAETAIQTPAQSSSYDSVAKPMQRKRSLPINDRNNRMQTNSKRFPKEKNSTEMQYQRNRRSYSSAQKGNLNNHVRTHTREKPFKCSQCSFASAHKSSLDRHVRTHSGEKPFKCDQCSYTNAHRRNLVIHTRIHTGEKPFKCDQCSYASIHKGNLVKHIRTHTGKNPFKCSQCSYSSAEKSSLNSHERTHKREKPFKCSQCSYSSAQKVNLENHVLTHTGEKPFKLNQGTNASTTNFES